ncbi:MAG: NADH-quinone oxidoreductase subunit A [Deltaproteobacteria bacterium]|nr:NADH-quinone oxidoreductase subunit A [Deltaproteobacteria bacterium]
MLMAYGAVAIFFMVAAGFIFGSMIMGKLIRPDHPYAEKLATYECGEAPVGSAWFNFNPRFYIIALIYIIFDVEIAFIYPITTVFRRWIAQGWGWVALLEVVIFIAILLLGLVYVWAKGDLEWIRSVRGGAALDARLGSRATPETSADGADADSGEPLPRPAPAE